MKNKFLEVYPALRSPGIGDTVKILDQNHHAYDLIGKITHMQLFFRPRILYAVLFHSNTRERDFVCYFHSTQFAVVEIYNEEE